MICFLLDLPLLPEVCCARCSYSQISAVIGCWLLFSIGTGAVAFPTAAGINTPACEVLSLWEQPCVIATSYCMLCDTRHVLFLCLSGTRIFLRIAECVKDNLYCLCAKRRWGKGARKQSNTIQKCYFCKYDLINGSMTVVLMSRAETIWLLLRSPVKSLVFNQLKIS